MCVWLVCVTTFQRERERDSEGYIPLFGARILITFKLLITRKERRGRNGYRAVFLQVSSFLERETERKDASQTDTRFLQKLVMIPLGEKKIRNVMQVYVTPLSFLLDRMFRWKTRNYTKRQWLSSQLPVIFPSLSLLSPWSVSVTIAFLWMSCNKNNNKSCTLKRRHTRHTIKENLERKVMTDPAQD